MWNKNNNYCWGNWDWRSNTKTVGAWKEWNGKMERIEQQEQAKVGESSLLSFEDPASC